MKTNMIFFFKIIFRSVLLGMGNTVIPRLTSDPANEFSANEDFLIFFGLG